MTTRNNNTLVAIIAEGNTEQAILDVLIKHNAIRYSSDELLQEEIIRCRSGRGFAKKYLNKSIGKNVLIYRVLDSKKKTLNYLLPIEKKFLVLLTFTHDQKLKSFLFYFMMIIKNLKTKREQ